MTRQTLVPLVLHRPVLAGCTPRTGQLYAAGRYDISSLALKGRVMGCTALVSRHLAHPL
jgi:hypothetical protein